MFRRYAGHHGEEDRKDIFAPVADLMVGVVFIFIILMIALSLNLQAEDKVPRADYDQKVAELARTTAALNQRTAEVEELRRQLEEVRRALAAEQAARQASEALVAKLRADNARLVEVVRFVRQQSVVSLLERLSRADQTRATILAEMKRRLEALGTTVTVNTEAGTMALPSRALFASGQAEPSRDGKAIITRLGGVIAAVLPCYIPGSSDAAGCPQRNDATSLSAVYVEGHTDAQPFGAPTPRFRDNWDLSAGRAIEAYKHLLSTSDAIQAMRNQNGQALIGVSGYADSRPANPGAANRYATDVMEGDRRIEVRLLMSTNPEMVEAVLRDLGQQLERVDDLVR